MSDTHTDADPKPDAKADKEAETKTDAKPDNEPVEEAKDGKEAKDGGKKEKDGKDAEPPDDNELPARLEAAAPRRWRNRATPWLVAAVLLTGGFLGGVEVQKTWGTTSPTTAAGSPGASQDGFAGQVPDFTPASGFPGGGFRNGTDQETTGTLKSVTTTALTIRTKDGKTRTVKIAESTKIRQTVTIGKLKAGRPVTVQGSTAPDGTVTATAVTIS